MVGAPIAIVTPAPARSRTGNRVTALRWAMLLRRLGHRVLVAEHLPQRPIAALLAVHARKSAAAISAFAAMGRANAAAVLLAGTDVYPRFEPDRELRTCLTTAHRIIALQPMALELLPLDLRAKARVLVQSATAVVAARPTDAVQACILAHLRAVKDPLLPFAALAYVSAQHRMRILLAGSALDQDLAAAAARPADPRARWLGELRHREARQLLASSHVCIVPSHGEGGANVLSEAIAAGTPLLATAIPGNTGLLGTDWPGLFPAGDARALGRLLTRIAAEPAFLLDLRRRTALLRPLVEPAREQRGLAQLLTELGAPQA